MAKRCLGCMELYEDEYEVCPHCGFVCGTSAEEKIHMDPGTMLQERYTIGKVLGYGGFGVTYIAWDSRLEQKVAIKEYLPSDFSTRMPGHTQVSVFSGDKSEQFNTGLNKFTEEAKRLAKFTAEDGIVRIFDSFEENGTAYIVMELLDGETLASRLEREGKIPEEEAVNLLMPVMEALKGVHGAGMLHRDISPDNIFLTRTGEVKLIDFGAARYSTATHSRSLTVMIKSGYSPEEQYRSKGDQGPYTDVYAIAATLYRMITGKTPPDAMERRAAYENRNRDILIEPHKIIKEVSKSREVAILNAMNVRIEDRTPDITTFIEELNADPPAKRRYGKIRKLDFYHWPLWLKIAVPCLLGCIAIFLVLLSQGVILTDPLKGNAQIPEGFTETPDVMWMGIAEATNEIEQHKLNVKISHESVSNEYVESGVVCIQNPRAGIIKPECYDVVLTISRGDVIPGLVPYVIGCTVEDAKKMFQTAGLEPEDTLILEYCYNDIFDEGTVISQSIDYGIEIEAGMEIILEISKGPEPFDMPAIVGLNIEDVKKTLMELGLTVIEVHEENTTVDEGTILRHDKGGELVRRGDMVTLVVATKEQTIEVPNVTGFDQASAESALRSLGFEVQVLQDYSTVVEAGYIISQDPEAWSEHLVGTTIYLYVSIGPDNTNVDPYTNPYTQIQEETTTEMPTLEQETTTEQTETLITTADRQTETQTPEETTQPIQTQPAVTPSVETQPTETPEQVEIRTTELELPVETQPIEPELPVETQPIEPELSVETQPIDLELPVETQPETQPTEPEISDWVEESQVPFEAETADSYTQYRYRTIEEYIESDQSDLEGYILYDDPIPVYGFEKQDWTTEYPKGNYIDLEEREGSKPQFYYWRYTSEKDPLSASTTKHDEFTIFEERYSDYPYDRNYFDGFEDPEYGRIWWGGNVVYISCTEYRYKYETIVSYLYKYYKYGDWTAWSEKQEYDPAITEEETRTYCKYYLD